jgi:hypothetical protein
VATLTRCRWKVRARVSLFWPLLLPCACSCFSPLLLPQPAMTLGAASALLAGDFVVGSFGVHDTGHLVWSTAVGFTAQSPRFLNGIEAVVRGVEWSLFSCPTAERVAVRGVPVADCDRLVAPTQVLVLNSDNSAALSAPSLALPHGRFLVVAARAITQPYMDTFLVYSDVVGVELQAPAITAASVTVGSVPQSHNVLVDARVIHDVRVHWAFPPSPAVALHRVFWAVVEDTVAARAAALAMDPRSSPALWRFTRSSASSSFDAAAAPFADFAGVSPAMVVLARAQTMVDHLTDAVVSPTFRVALTDVDTPITVTLEVPVSHAVSTPLSMPLRWSLESATEDVSLQSWTCGWSAGYSTVTSGVVSGPTSYTAVGRSIRGEPTLSSAPLASGRDVVVIVSCTDELGRVVTGASAPQVLTMHRAHVVTSRLVVDVVDADGAVVSPVKVEPTVCGVPTRLLHTSVDGWRVDASVQLRVSWDGVFHNTGAAPTLAQYVATLHIGDVVVDTQECGADCTSAAFDVVAAAAALAASGTAGVCVQHALVARVTARYVTGDSSVDEEVVTSAPFVVDATEPVVAADCPVGGMVRFCDPATATPTVCDAVTTATVDVSTLVARVEPPSCVVDPESGVAAVLWRMVLARSGDMAFDVAEMGMARASLSSLMVLVNPGATLTYSGALLLGDTVAVEYTALNHVGATGAVVTSSLLTVWRPQLSALARFSHAASTVVVEWSVTGEYAAAAVDVGTTPSACYIEAGPLESPTLWTATVEHPLRTVTMSLSAAQLAQFRGRQVFATVRCSVGGMPLVYVSPSVLLDVDTPTVHWVHVVSDSPSPDVSAPAVFPVVETPEGGVASFPLTIEWAAVDRSSLRVAKAHISVHVVRDAGASGGEGAVDVTLADGRTVSVGAAIWEDDVNVDAVLASRPTLDIASADEVCVERSCTAFDGWLMEPFSMLFRSVLRGIPVLPLHSWSHVVVRVHVDDAASHSAVGAVEVAVSLSPDTTWGTGVNVLPGPDGGVAPDCGETWCVAVAFYVLCSLTSLPLCVSRRVCYPRWCHPL